MQTNRADIADLTYFLAIARHRSFSRAAIEIGVSASALSHALKALEGRLGVRLLNRTTKSVTLTAAGEALAAAIGEPFEVIDTALETLNRFRDAPTGRIRLNVAVEAANLLVAPVLASFIERYPDVELEIVANNRMVDVTDAGFDAGIRYGGTVPEDMIAQSCQRMFAGWWRDRPSISIGLVLQSIPTICFNTDASVIDLEMTEFTDGSLSATTRRCR